VATPKYTAVREDALSTAAVVFVATPDALHCDAAKEWLTSATNIYVEKPLDVSLSKTAELRELIDKLAGDGQESDEEGPLSATDHYLMRAVPMLGADESGELDLDARVSGHLQDKISFLEFHLLESSDKDLEKRKNSLQEGMLMDLCPHVLAVIAPIGDLSSLRRRGKVRAGIYESSPPIIKTDGKDIFESVPGKRAGRESFAEVFFSFRSPYARDRDGYIPGVVRIGKCVGAKPDKKLTITGGIRNDRNVVADFGACKVWFNGAYQFDLLKEPVWYMVIRAVLTADEARTVAVLSPEGGEEIVKTLLNWRKPIESRIREKPLDSYPGGADLDDVLDMLEPF
jgi:hypothetical protein